MINQSSLGQTTAFGAVPSLANFVQDFAVTSPPDDSISSLSFSPATICQNFLIAGSWDNIVRCWQVEQTGNTVPKSFQTLLGPVLDMCWTEDGTKVFLASCENTVKCWDLASNQTMVVAAHTAPVRTCHWVKAPNYSCLMTGSWDKTLRFWDLRSPNPMMVITLPEKVHCADVEYPMAVVCTANQHVIVYRLESKPTEFSRISSTMKQQNRCIAIFKDKEKMPTGVAIGGVEGRVAIQYVNPDKIKDNYSFPCHRKISNAAIDCYDVYAVNDLTFHPVHGTLATAGSDGSFGYWDTAGRKKLKTSDLKEQSITRCCFNANGQIFAYAISYDWSKGHEFYNPTIKNRILLRPCMDETKSAGAIM